MKTIIAIMFVLALDLGFFLCYDWHNCSTAVWAAVIGLNIAYVSLFLIPLLDKRERGLKVLSDSLYLIGGIYMFFEIVLVGWFLIIMIQQEHIWLCFQWIQEHTQIELVTQQSINSPMLIIITQVVLFGIYIITLLANVMANDTTRKAVAQQAAESNDIRMLLNEASEIRLLVKADATAYNLVTQCYDDIKASPLRSAPEAAGIEREINATLLSMRNCAQQGDLANIPTLSQQIRHLIAQRNLKLKNISNY